MDRMRAYTAIKAWFNRNERRIRGLEHHLVPAAFLLVGIYLCVFSPEGGIADRFRWKVFDQFQRWKPRVYQDAHVRIVDIDDESLRRFGQWPWPRTLLARLVDRMTDAGVSALAFDAVFSEPDRTSPALLSQEWPKTPEFDGARRSLRSLPDHDREFARALARSRAVVGFAMTSEGDSKPAIKASIGVTSLGGEDNTAALASVLMAERAAVPNLPIIEAAAAGDGSISFTFDADGVIRAAPLIFLCGNTLVPSLSAEVLRVAQGASSIMVKFFERKQFTGLGHQETVSISGVSKIKIGSFIIPTDESGRVWIYFTNTAQERLVPAWCVLEKGCADAKLDGNMVFIGTSAAGLKDLRRTPLNPAAPGVEVHANLVENIILGEYLRRPSWAYMVETGFVILIGLLVLFSMARGGAAVGALIAASFMACGVLFSAHAFTTWHYLLDPVIPCLTVLLIYLSSSLIGYLRTEAERKQVKGAFSRYMSPALVDQLAKHPEKLQLGGEMRVMTFHFCDIRGFTTISEQFDPHGLTQFINRFLTPMTEIILQHQGVIDKYMGDCIMAFWNAPLDDPDHARHACQAALKMHARLEQLNKDLKVEADAAGRKFIPIHIGTGLNTGGCVVGNMGSEQRFDYSVLGDDVNLASRLEGQSKTYGVNVIIGPKTREMAPEFASLELDLIKVKGKTVPVHIYTLLGDQAVKDSADFKELAARHEEMLAAFRSRDWDKAEKLIADCRKFPFNLKVLYDRYVNDYIAFYRDHPPLSDWDGSFTATSK
jgi:adenylate cyclase